MAKQNVTFTSEQMKNGNFEFGKRQNVENVNQSAISAISDFLACDCNINLSDFTIFSKETNNFNLLIKEILLIADG